MPGCGKSTFGKKVAGEMNLRFIDLDKEIGATEGISINEIFEKKGENYFREIESSLLKDLTLRHSRFIMATGGGAPCFFDNMDFMNANGITFYIKAEVTDLLERLSDKGISKRPLLKDVRPEDLFTELEDKLRSRQVFYERSAFILPYHASLHLEIIEAVRNLPAKT